MKLDSGLVAQHDFADPVIADDTETVTTAEKVMAFAGDHFAGGLPRLAFKPCTLAFDPAELANDGQTHSFVADSERRGYPYPSMRRIDP